jgi:hypothetical protein
MIDRDNPKLIGHVNPERTTRWDKIAVPNRRHSFQHGLYLSLGKLAEVGTVRGSRHLSVVRSAAVRTAGTRCGSVRMLSNGQAFVTKTVVAVAGGKATR